MPTGPLPLVVVLGGSGFVGRHVVPRLVADGYRVVVVTRRRARARHLFLLPTVDVVEADAADTEALARCLRDACALVNLIGIIAERDEETFARVHVEMTARAIAACKSAGVTRFVQMSALNADPAGPSRYLRSKGEAEEFVTQSGLAWTIFQPSVIFGPEDAFLNLFAKLMRMLPVVALGAPNARFQPVYVGDVATCFVHTLGDDATIGERYRLCGPKVYTLHELVRYVGEVSETRRPIMTLGPALTRLQASVLEHLPGKVMTRDNLASMEKDSVCGCAFPAVFDIVPTALEAIAAGYLAPYASRSRFDEYRATGGR